jgi:hypothetical protein
MRQSGPQAARHASWLGYVWSLGVGSKWRKSNDAHGHIDPFVILFLPAREMHRHMRQLPPVCTPLVVKLWVGIDWDGLHDSLALEAGVCRRRLVPGPLRIKHIHDRTMFDEIGEFHGHTPHRTPGCEIDKLLAARHAVFVFARQCVASMRAVIECHVAYAARCMIEKDSGHWDTHW